jgi:hypothetical protein
VETERIPTGRWRAFLESFTGAHRNWLVTLDTGGRGRAPVRQMQDVPLIGIFEEPHRFVIVTGHDPQRVDRIVEDPVSLECPVGPEGADVGLDIETRAGDRIRLRFRSAVRSELVDGF